MRENVLKERLKSGEPAFCFSVRMARTVNIVALAEAVGYHGFYVDLQHSSLSVDSAAQICAAALHADVTAFVRVPSLELGLIARLLDAGAQGILAPDIRSAAEAEALVRAALIAPKGERSVGGGIPNPRFAGVSGSALAAAINDATLLIAMIETEGGCRERGRDHRCGGHRCDPDRQQRSDDCDGHSGGVQARARANGLRQGDRGLQSCRQAADHRRHPQGRRARALRAHGCCPLLLHRRRTMCSCSRVPGCS